MTCDEFHQSYLEGDVSTAGEAHLRGCADCQRVTPELGRLQPGSVSYTGSHVASTFKSAGHSVRTFPAYR